MPVEKTEPPPFIYVVVYESDDVPGDDYEPIVYGETALTREGATMPHLLPTEMEPALAALWYCLHLPRHWSDLVDLPYSALAMGRDLPTGHRIMLMPIGFVTGTLSDERAPQSRTLLIGPDSLYASIQKLSHSFSFVLPPAQFGELSSDSLREHWSGLRDHCNLPSHFGPASEFELSALDERSSLTLPLIRLKRQLGLPIDGEPQSASLIEHAFMTFAIQAAASEVEASGVEENENEELAARLPTVAAQLRLPVALGLPGQSERQFRRYGTSSNTSANSGDSTIEQRAISIMVSHQAVARDSWGMVLPTCPTDAFRALAELEAHAAGNAKPRGIARIRAKLDRAIAPLWAEDLVQMIKRASSIQLLSDFPLGLVRMPEFTDPLAMVVPMSMRSITPLSRTLPRTLSAEQGAPLSTLFKTVVCECIPASDNIGRASRAAWASIKSNFAVRYPHRPFQVVETLTERQLRETIQRERPDVLIISAHGFSRPDSNMAGIMVGDTPSLGIGLGPLPPLVILSACHVDPRGTGAVTIADLLLREGAVAILATLIPVDVFHNAILVNRFLLYLHEALEGNEPERTLGAVWHRVQASHAVHDVTSANNDFNDWFMHPRSDGPSPQERFKSTEWSRRLKRGHIYRDSEDLLKEIAKELGEYERVNSWITSQSYVPETMFYTFLGNPEDVILGDWSIVDKSHST